MRHTVVASLRGVLLDEPRAVHLDLLSRCLERGAQLLGVGARRARRARLCARGCRSLRALLEYSGPGTVEDVFCQVMAIEEEVAGTVETVPLCPGGESIPVTEENRRDFVDRCADFAVARARSWH